MLISKLGEFGLIERFNKRIKLDASVVRGSGDDCAVLAFNKNQFQLFTCDMIVEGVDFMAKTDPYLVGRKAIAVSISDIASCAGTPRHCVVSLGLPRKSKVAFVDRLVSGMLDMARKYKINIVGGDLSRADKLVIDVSMLGIVEKKKLALRNQAKIGDIIFVTGSLGGSIRGKHLKFSPRLKEARQLTKRFKLHAMIDISDGLTQDLGHILEQSKVGAVIYENLIPVSRDARDIKEALYMGEDFELLFTLSRADAKKLLRDRSGTYKPIGEIVERIYGLELVNKHSGKKILKIKGYQHFK